MTEWHLNSSAALTAMIEAGASGGMSLIKQATISLTNAQIKAISDGAVTTPFVASPGAGKMLVLVNAVVRVDTTAGAYTNIDTTDAILDIRWSGSSLASNRSENGSGGGGYTNFSGLFGAGGIITAILLPSIDQVIGGSDLASQISGEHANLGFDLEIYNGAGDLTGGHASNSLRASVSYMVLDVATGIYE